jgi:hypothetical protein
VLKAASAKAVMANAAVAVVDAVAVMVTAPRVMVTAHLAVTVRPAWTVIVLHVSKVTAQPALIAIVHPVMATAPHAKASSHASRVNPAPKAKDAANVVAVAATNALTAPHAATCQHPKIKRLTLLATASTSKMHRKTLASNAPNALRVKTAVKVVAVSVANAVDVAVASALHATNSAMTSPKAAHQWTMAQLLLRVSCLLEPPWQWLPVPIWATKVSKLHATSAKPTPKNTAMVSLVSAVRVTAMAVTAQTVASAVSAMMVMLVLMPIKPQTMRCALQPLWI